MKDNDFQDIKLIVRLRGITEGKPPTQVTEESADSKQTKQTNTKAQKQNTPNQNKTIEKKDAKKSSKTNNPQQSEKKETDEDLKYTIFTSVQPSKTIICTNTPISKKLINSTFIREDDLYEYSYTFIKDSTLLEFDRIYSDTYKVETIYNEQVKECISNLFLGKNACLIQFGPSDSGKAYLSRNSDANDLGLIPRSINDIFNLIEISKSSNKSLNAKNVSTIFSVKMSIHQVYNDCLNDLLSTQYSKNLNVERFFDDGDINQNLIPELTMRELKSKKDFELAMKEAENVRKNLSQSLKVNDINKKSHFVTSFYIEKREKIPDGYNRITEQAIENFAQIDFVELADSNYGLSNQPEEADFDNKREEEEEVDDLLYRFISKTFNSVTNNILAAANRKGVKNETKLTLSLKNTLKINSQILMFTNAIPFEEPLLNSIKALKFSNWLRNQLNNQKEFNITNKIPPAYKNKREALLNKRDIEENYDEEERYRNSNKKPQDNQRSREFYSRDKPERDENIDPRNNFNFNYNYKYDKDRRVNEDYANDDENNLIQRRSREVLSNNYYNNTYGDENPASRYNKVNDFERKGFLNSSVERQDEFEESKNRFNYKYQTINNDSLNDGEIKDKENINFNNYSRYDIRSEAKQPHIRSESKNYNNYDHSYISQNQSKLVDVERTLRDLEAKSVEMSKHIENLRNERSRIEDNRYTSNNNSVLMKNNFNNIDYDLEKLRQENSMLKSDNIIFREDINRLSDINRHLEEEIRRQRERNLELASENERISQEKNQFKLGLDKANESITRSKIQEQTAIDQLNMRFVLENKIKDLENENRSIREDKQRYEVDYKVLQERYLELKKNFDANENELNFIKHKQAEEVNNIEEKLDRMAREIEHLQRDNNTLRSNEERIRQELVNLEKQRDNYREKYQETKSKNTILNTKLTEIEEEFKKLMYDKQNEYDNKVKEEEKRKTKIDSKQKILEDMQNKILTYKTEILKNRNKKD